MTRAEIREQIRLRTGISADDTRMTTFIEQLIRSEYERICLEERLLDGVATLPVVIGDERVDLPSDWTRTLQVKWGSTVMQPVNAYEFAAMQAEGYTGTPVYREDRPDRIRVLPVPVATDPTAILLWYVARPTPLDTDAESPDALPVEFHDLLTEAVVYRIALAEEADAMAAAAKAASDELRARLRMHVSMRGGPGSGRIPLPPVARR